MPRVSSEKARPNRQWALSFLWINLAVAMVVLMLVAWNVVSGVRELLQVLLYSLTCANLAGVLGVLIIGRFAGHFAGRTFPLVFVVAAGVIVVTGLACFFLQVLPM